MRDCKFKNPVNCADRPSNGLGVVSHCLTCWLARDRENTADKIKRQRQEAQVFRSYLEARLERLRKECGVGG